MKQLLINLFLLTSKDYHKDKDHKTLIMNELIRLNASPRDKRKKSQSRKLWNKMKIMSMN